jgi:hypothetical protein
MFFLLSNTAFALVQPLTPEMRDEKALVIATGEIVAVREGLVQLSIGTNAVYTVDMKVDSLERGQGFSKGDTLIFQYWKAAKRPKGWVGDFGQTQTLKKGDFVKVYLVTNQKAEGYLLLSPNGFEVVKK